MSRSWRGGTNGNWSVIRKRILQRDHNQCQQCGETEGEMHIDHIIPKRLVGAAGNGDDNLQVLCKRCNLQKGGSFFDTPRHPRLFHSEKTPNASVSHD